ncbi:MAG TPA: hypothetical protein VE991_14765 [Acidimicrobiales bacterium]|nr:hypothetical protein [Acidimicrobiales bacterium]
MRREERGRVTALLGIAGGSSMALVGLLVSNAQASGTPAPAAYKTQAAKVSTTSAPPVTIPPTTTTTAPPPPPTTTTTAPPPPPTTTSTAPAAAPGWGCSYALAYLAAHAAPGFTSSCPGPNDGHQATTTALYSNGTVTGTIGIEVPCPAAYMNEAHNSWVLRARYLGTSIPDGLGTVIDPYGYCH